MNRIFSLVAFLMMSGGASAQETALPHSVDLTPRFQKFGLKVRNQGSRPNCGTFAITALAEFESAKTGAGAQDFSEEFLWWACDRAGGLKKDHSVLFQRVVNGLNKLGICTEELMPYAKKTDFNRNPSPAALKDGRQRAGRWQVIWIRHWDVKGPLQAAQELAIKGALASGHPVACGLRWPKNGKGDDRLLDVPAADQVEDGHSIAFVGYEDNATVPGGGFFHIRNSWGPGWGTGGYGTMSYAYARTYLNDALYLRLGAPQSEIPAERFAAEALLVHAKQRCEVSSQDMKQWGPGMWSNGKQLFCHAEHQGFVELELHVRKGGNYRLRVLATVAPDYGIVQIALDGKNVGRPFDLYSGMVGPSGSLELGTHDLTPGKHLLRFSAAKKNAASENFFFGLDAIDLLPAEKKQVRGRGIEVNEGTSFSKPLNDPLTGVAYWQASGQSRP